MIKQFSVKSTNFISNLLLVLVLFFSSAHLMFSATSEELCHRNTGISFGLLGGVSVYGLVFIQLVFLVIISALVLYLSSRSFSMRWVRLMFVSIAAVSFSNLLDRLVFGGVCDYFNLSLFTRQFGRQIFFNINDIIIVLIISILLFNELLDVRKDRIQN